MHRPLVLLVAAGLLQGAAPLQAQRLVGPFWVITISGGGGGEGPGRSLAEHLQRLGGFDHKEVCSLQSCVDFPRFRRAAPQWSITMGRRLRGRIGVRAFGGAGELGWAAGEGDSGSINWHWSSKHGGLQMTYDLPVTMFGDAGWGATFAAGPMLARVASGRGLPRAYPSDSLKYATRLGLQVNAHGYMYPSRTKRWFFFGIEVGYRLLGGRSEGPYPLDTGNGVLPPFHAKYSHFMAGSFIGLRLRSLM